MIGIIIHHDGVFNLYSTNSDAPIFVSGLTEEQLRSYIKDEYGRSGLEDAEHSIKRAKEIGTSSRTKSSLQETVKLNRSGHNETNVMYKEFLKRFMVIREDDDVAVQDES